MSICIEHIRLAQMSYMNISFPFPSLSRFFLWEMSHHRDVSNTNIEFLFN